MDTRRKPQQDATYDRGMGLDTVTAVLLCSIRWAAVASLLSVSLAVISFRIPNWVITRRFLCTGSLEPPGYIDSETFVRSGLQIIKYFTITGDYGGSVVTSNPFVDQQKLASLDQAWHYYLLRPLDSFSSVTTKLFALIDWDVPFAFNNNSLESAPGWLSLINYFLVAKYYGHYGPTLCCW